MFCPMTKRLLIFRIRIKNQLMDLCRPFGLVASVVVRCAKPIDKLWPKVWPRKILRRKFWVSSSVYTVCIQDTAEFDISAKISLIPAFALREKKFFLSTLWTSSLRQNCFVSGQPTRQSGVCKVGSVFHTCLCSKSVKCLQCMACNGRPQGKIGEGRPRGFVSPMTQYTLSSFTPTIIRCWVHIYYLLIISDK